MSCKNKNFTSTTMCILTKYYRRWMKVYQGGL